MFKFFKKKKRFPADYPSLKKTWQDLGEKLVQVVCYSSFEIFKAQEFRELTGFEGLDQTEQDRLFNELEVTGICLLLFLLDDYIELVKNDDDDPVKKQVFISVRDAVKPEFLKILKGLDIEQKHLDTWGKLIDLRFKEYKKDIPEIEKAFRQMGENFKTPKIKLLERRTQIMAAGGHTHICRGRTDSRDKLYLQIRRWLAGLDNKLSMPFDKGLKKKLKHS